MITPEAPAHSVDAPPDTVSPPSPRPQRPRKLRDSSKTRIVPVFDELHRRGDPDWVRRLLDLAADSDSHSARPWLRQNLQVEEHGWGEAERPLDPPVSLLAWLIRNLEAPAGGRIRGRAAVVERRQALLRQDVHTVHEALRLLRRGSRRSAWYVLEGPSYPDAYLETPDALIVVEGKRTERGPTIGTEWMAGRHQMLRHLDCVWELRARRAVYGLFIVEADISVHPTAVPPAWRDAARLTTSDEAIQASLPHRGPAEQESIRRAFIGVTTWQAIVNEFALGPAVLPDAVGGARE